MPGPWCEAKFTHLEKALGPSTPGKMKCDLLWYMSWNPAAVASWSE